MSCLGRRSGFFVVVVWLCWVIVHCFREMGGLGFVLLGAGGIVGAVAGVSGFVCSCVSSCRTRSRSEVRSSCKAV